MPSRSLYLPHLEIEVARTIRYRGHTWYDLHKDLATKGLRMPLLSEFLALLKTDNLCFTDGQELSLRRRRVIQRYLLGKEHETSGEFLDAQFIYRGGHWYLHQRHRFGSNGFDLLFKELPLEELVLSAGVLNLTDFLSLGVPSQLSTKGIISYRPPEDRRVACYFVNKGKASLRFDYDPNAFGFRVGVRPVRDRRSEVA